MRSGRNFDCRCRGVGRLWRNLKGFGEPARNFGTFSQLNQDMANNTVTDSDNERKIRFEEDICIHIFTVSSAMVGVCLTVIGLIRVVITLGTADTLADDLLAADALLFLVSSLLSYWALRSRGLRRMHRLEKIADAIFMIAMVGMVVVCALITYSISVPTR